MDEDGIRRQDEQVERDGARDGVSEIENLLRRGGWELVDPAPLAAENPETFEMPSPDDLAALRPGRRVRATFRTATIADPVRDGVDPYDQQGRPVLVPITERMWLIVIGCKGDLLECVMNNHPYGTHTRLLPMDRVRIPISHLIATTSPVTDYQEFADFLAKWESDPENPQIDPTTPVDPLGPPRLRSDQQAVVNRTGVPAHPPYSFAKVLVSKNVTPEAEPMYGARFDPKPERDDCGWVFFTGPTDLNEVSETVGFNVLSLQEAVERHPKILAYLAMAPGWAFTLFHDGDDVYTTDMD